jgi:hypothetical protein
MFVTTRLRLMAGGTALAAGLLILTTATGAPPTLPKDAYKKAAEADIAAIQKLLNGGMPEKRAMPTIKAIAMMLAFYGEASDNAALKSQALQVAEAAAKKDYAMADTLAKGLSAPKAGPAAKGSLDKQAKFNLDEAMSALRLSKVGGLNIESDIRNQMKMVNDVKLLEVLGVRTVAIAEYCAHYPNDKASSGANMAKWDKLSKEMGSLGKQLTDEASKGNAANTKAITGILQRLNANCSNCHNDFRD